MFVNKCLQNMEGGSIKHSFKVFVFYVFTKLVSNTSKFTRTLIQIYVNLVF